MKKLAKQELRQTRQQGFPTAEIQSLAQKFFCLVHSHSRLKKSASARLSARSARQIRSHCYKQFVRYARELLDADSSSNITPDFDAEQAHHFFSTVYRADPKNFIQPDWMPSPPPPEVQMDCSPFTDSEIFRVMKKMKAASAPSPFDRIGYVVFKKCPALIPALVDIFNFCWSHSAVPHQWKTAAIKLIAKGSAVEDASNPSNFRPIALTPCIGKVFTTLLRNRWLKFMLLSGSLRRVNILQYADDICLVANSPSACQYLLSKVGDWLVWTGMAAKVPKCQCLSLEGSTGKLRDPQLLLRGASIPFTEKPVRFLELDVQVASHHVCPRSNIVARLQKMLTAIDRVALTRRQKFLMYSAGVCPRLTWPLLTQEFPITWVERELDSLAIRYIKHWAGLTKSANTAILYLPNLMGGLNLPR